MDTSKTYIKMRKRAHQIKPLNTTPFFEEDAENVYPHIFIDEDGTFWWREMNEDTDLPRQDQLQDILWGDFRIPCAELKLLYEDIHFIKDPVVAKYYWQFTSMEQLWLAFLFDKKYNKRWDGNEWILK